MGAKKRPAPQKAAASQKVAAESEPSDVQEEEVMEIGPPALFRSSAKLASFTAKYLKVGVARIAEQSKSQEATGSDKMLDILVSDVQPPQDPPRQVSARIDDMDAARARIDEFSAKMGSQLLSANTLESSTKVVSILTSLVTKAAELASQAKEGLDVGLAIACQLRDAQARVSSLEEKVDKVNRELHTSRSNEVVLQSQLGTAREASRAAIVCEVAAKNAEKAVRQELESVREELAAEKQAMQDQLKKNEELGAEKELVEARLADAAQYFFGKGRVDAMRDPDSDRANWDSDRGEAALDAQHIANLRQSILSYFNMASEQD
ncbi:uncharacterized protein LOC141651942 [Silene latifolia]|uniref:uncharacterized protein LOC141651942 n=1 Tax=Silene latifolia TaxID=37657 RepID=UPI003D777900